MEGMTLVREHALQRDDVVVRGGPFTRADRDALPADGRRHELLDGVLILSPAPRTRHQAIARELVLLLSAAIPRELRLYFAPFDVRQHDHTAIQPDLVIARRDDVSPDGFTLRPLLAIEIASPSTRVFDLGAKKAKLAEIGCPHYWTIEPIAADGLPELTVWHLVDGAYEQVAVVGGQDAHVATAPFEVTVRPADLLDD